MRYVFLLVAVIVLYRAYRYASRIYTKRIKAQELTEQLNNLSPPEQEILKKVSSGLGCGVWVKQTDAAVQTLIYKGLIEQLGDVQEFQDWGDDRTLCILVSMSKALSPKKRENKLKHD